MESCVPGPLHGVAARLVTDMSTAAAAAISSPPVLPDYAPTTLKKKKRMQPSQPLLDQYRGHRSAGDEKDGEAKLLIHSPTSQTSRLELER